MPEEARLSIGTSLLYPWGFLISVIVVLIVSFYIFYYEQNYDFTVEAPCDASREICFQRDCSDGSCPPNDLDTYRVFLIPAGHFSECTDNSCLNICSDHGICTEQLCSARKGDSCIGPEATP